MGLFKLHGWSWELWAGLSLQQRPPQPELWGKEAEADSMARPETRDFIENSGRRENRTLQAMDPLRTLYIPYLKLFPLKHVDILISI